MKHGPQPAVPTAIRQVKGADESLPLLDTARLDALLAAVGPARVATVLDQLDRDLHAIVSGLGLAITAQQWPDARRFTHNLMAIAGTTGAARLADLSHHLHADCQRGHLADAAASLPAMQDLIAALLSALTARRNRPVTR
jgi:HPt (histidine-containing phosphotransfer) domain-containing protein